MLEEPLTDFLSPFDHMLENLPCFFNFPRAYMHLVTARTKAHFWIMTLFPHIYIYTQIFIAIKLQTSFFLGLSLIIFFLLIISQRSKIKLNGCFLSSGYRMKCAHYHQSNFTGLHMRHGNYNGNFQRSMNYLCVQPYTELFLD